MSQSKAATSDQATRIEPAAADRDRWIQMYRKMLEIRLFEEQVNAL
jgi:TPP-dependent pyruvate/acetoin dehydrogenase alpha subunit